MSVVVATGRDRRAFLGRLLRCWDAQTLDHDARELIVVDDGDDGLGARMCHGRIGVTHLSLGAPALLGDKLNAGCAAACGDVLAKWDDDDWYAPRYLETALAAMAGCERGSGFVLWGEYLVLLLTTGALHTTGPGHKAGNTLTFDRELWMSAPFRSLPSSVDSAFIEDHPGYVAVDDPTAVVVVRHGSNTWTEFRGIDVDPYIAANLSAWPEPLAEVVGPEAACFYQALRDNSEPSIEVDS